jgi:hypothetical protein
MKTVWDKLYNFYWKNLGGWGIKNFLVSVENLIRWFPIIWRDRDWDDHYIWEILKNKLRWQAKYIGDRDWHTRSEMDARRMRLCASLMDKIQSDFYQAEYMDYHESSYNWLPVEDSESVQLDIKTESERFDEYFKKYPLVYKKILADKNLQVFCIEDENYKQRIAMNIGRYNHKRARKLLFLIMEENIEGWWD